MRNPVDRLTAGLPHPVRVTIDWVVTIVGAVALVLAIKAWVINPYRIPTASMEPALHCAKPERGCTAMRSDRVLANRFILHLRKPKRGDILVFNTPAKALQACGTGGTFVKRLIGLPGETVSERDGRIFINGKRLAEPYVLPEDRDRTSGGWKVPADSYFMMGDNRDNSCDSRQWGAVPRSSIIGPVVATYWPPTRIKLW
jgi:signal peptidase I